MVRIGTVSDTFITVTGVPGKKDPVYGGNNAVEKDRKGGGASSNYVVATGIYEEFDDNGYKRRMVEISSWGNKYYVDYDQYIDVVSQNPLNQPFSSVMNTKIK